MNTTGYPQPVRGRLRRSPVLPLSAAIGVAVLAAVVHARTDWSSPTPAPTVTLEMSVPSQEPPLTLAEIVEHVIAEHSAAFPWPSPSLISPPPPVTLEETRAEHDAIADALTRFQLGGFR